MVLGIPLAMSDPSPSSEPVAGSGPYRPPMDPAAGVRRLTLAPHEMTDAVTAGDDVFVLAHMGIPRVDPHRWTLAVNGLVGYPRTFGWEDLQALPRREVLAVHECCGSPLEPTVPTRRVANVRWGGVDLTSLLDTLGIDVRARFLWSYGLDGGGFAGRSCEWYVKDLPLERLAAGDVLLADEMNGRPLSAEHGFPLRLVVPGYYGTNNVKWLWQLHLAERRAEGPFTTTFYSDVLGAADVAAGLPSRQPVWAQAPQSIIVAPRPDAIVGRDELVEVWGWAWSFRGIDAVTVSVDGGASFVRADLERRLGWSWQRFSFPWYPPNRGEVVLQARAFEAGGASQPDDGARNAVHRVHVTVA
jgi:DMSO/TMAO reductase YedYZ molybdopterin-dependent catalytic subunit